MQILSPPQFFCMLIESLEMANNSLSRSMTGVRVFVNLLFSSMILYRNSASNGVSLSLMLFYNAKQITLQTISSNGILTTLPSCTFAAQIGTLFKRGLILLTLGDILFYCRENSTVERVRDDFLPVKPRISFQGVFLR